MSSTPSSPSDTPDPSLTAPEAAAAPAGDATPVPTPAATGAKLAELFPGLFKGQPKPLKLRVQVDIQERAPGVFSKQALSAFFRRYTGATSFASPAAARAAINNAANWSGSNTVSYEIPITQSNTLPVELDSFLVD